MKFSLLVGIALLGISGLLATSLAGPNDSGDDKAKALTRLDNDWSMVGGKKDLEGLLMFYADDAVVYPPNAPVAVGKDAIRKVWAPLLADVSATISWKTTRTEVAKSGDLGFTAGTYEISTKGADGKPAVEKGKYLCVWKLQKDGSWKATQDMWNADAK